MVGIIIPTKNRSGFLIRALRYYRSVNCRHTIYIGDSSSDEQSNQINSYIKESCSMLNIVYRRYPELGAAWTAREVVNDVEEEYAVCSGDDDLLIPNSLTYCETFLSKNKDYSSAHGRAITLEVEDSPKRFVINAASNYFLGQTELSTAHERLSNFLKKYWVVQFSVQRTCGMREAFADINRFKDQSFTEILCNCISIVQGKSKRFDDLHLVRQVHPSRGVLKAGLSWFMNEQFHPSYRVFLEVLAKHLAHKDNIDRELAQKLVGEYFVDYLEFSLLHSQIAPQRTDFYQLIVNFMRPFKPLIKSIYYQWRLMFLKDSNIYYLPILLKPTSKYHKDFYPVYKSLTEVS